MHDLNDDAVLLRALAPLETSALSDVLDGLGYPQQVLATQLRPLGAGGRLVGRAACAAIAAKPPAPPGAAPVRDYFADIDEMATPGSVLVLAVAPEAHGAVFGGFMAREYLRRGAAGVVTDGVVRDAAEIAGLPLQVLCAGTSPRNGAKGMQVLSIGQPVQLAGRDGGQVQVCDGDYVLADGDGVVVLPRRIAALAVEGTVVLAEMERRIGKAMAQGQSRIAAMRLHDRFAHLPALRARLA